MDITQAIAPPPIDPSPAAPSSGRLVTPDILFLNQGTTYRMGAAFGGTSNPTVVWQQMIDYAPVAFLYYRELEAKDDDVSDAIAEMKLSVLKRGWQVQPGDDTQLALDAAEFVRKQIEAVPTWRNALSNMMDAPFYGLTIAELMFDTSMGQAALQDIVDCPQELFCFAPYARPQIGPLALKTYASALDGTAVPEQKFLIYTSRSRHGNRMGSPILREVYWASWFKRNLQRFWLRLAERGPGTAVVTHADGASEAEKNNALAAAEALINEVAIAVPESFKVITELLHGTRSADPKTYESLYNVLEAKIYRRIVGGTLTSHGSDGGKGTHALGSVHQETKEERSVELCKEAAGVINRQLIRNLVLWNFGPACPLPSFAFDIGDEADLGADVTLLDTLQEMGLAIPKKYAYEHFGVPVPEKDEEVLERPVVPTPDIATPAGRPDRPQFSEAQQRQVDADAAELDKLFAELRRDALRTTAEQIGAVAAGVEHTQAARRA